MVQTNINGKAETEVTRMRKRMGKYHRPCIAVAATTTNISNGVPVIVIYMIHLVLDSEVSTAQKIT